MKISDPRVALITGASRNIGRAIALGLADDGFDIVINTRESTDAARQVADEVSARGQRAHVVKADISDSAQATALVEEAVSVLGSLETVVLNAAIRRQKPVTEITDDDWREVIGVALDGGFFVCRAAIPHLQANGHGRIVFLGGTPSHLGTRGRAHVCAAKMGAVGLMRTLATELGADNITCNTVAPGHIETVRGGAAGSRSSVTDARPIARRGDTGEIAGAVRWFCSDAAAYTTGQTLHVNGGMYYG